MADSPRPGVWALEKSMDNGNTSLVYCNTWKWPHHQHFLKSYPFVTFVISRHHLDHLAVLCIKWRRMSKVKQRIRFLNKQQNKFSRFPYMPLLKTKFLYQSVFKSGQVLQHARRWAHHEGRHGHMHHRLLKGLQPILNNAKSWWERWGWWKHWTLTIERRRGCLKTLSVN